MLLKSAIILQSENISRDTEKLIDDVGTALLSKMMVDQKPHLVRTQSMSMELNRLSPRALETSADFRDDNEAGFKLPLGAITDDKVKNTPYIDSVVSWLHSFPRVSVNILFKRKCAMFVAG